MHDHNGENAEKIRAHIAQITASELFAGAERLCRFLRFTVETTLNGREADVKEYTLGREVFDRGESYDPRLDPIVRVEARRLRSRLAEYYNGPGRDEPLRIEYRKGSYIPLFRAANGAPLQQSRWPTRRIAWIAGGAVVCIAAIVAGITIARLVAPPVIAPVPDTAIAVNDGTLDGVDVALAEAIDAHLANDPRRRVVAWPTIAQLHAPGLDLTQVAAKLGARELLVIIVHNEGSIRRINVFAIDEPQNLKRLAFTYYADRSLDRADVRDRYAARIARDLSR